MVRFLYLLRFAIRLLARSPGHALAMVALLSLGVGANAAVFSAIDQLLLRPLPFAEPDRLAKVWEDFSAFGAPRQRVSPATYLDWRRRTRSFSAVAAYRMAGQNLSDGGPPEQASGIAATANLLPTLGASPLLGRLFTDADDYPDPGVVVISYALWRRRFGGDPTGVGRTMTMDGRAFTVIGVLPRPFRFPDADAEYWMPLGLTPQLAARRNSHFLHVIARLAPGRSWADARADIGAIAAQLAREYPTTNARVGATVVPLASELLAGADRSVLLLFAAAACLLLLACANAANLALVRGTTRHRELAIRLALGASRGALVRALAIEAALVAAASVAGGLVLARSTAGGLAWLIPPAFSGRTPQVDTRVLLFAAAVASAASVFSALVPVLTMPRSALLASLASGGSRIAGNGPQRVRGALVVVEIALAMMLLATAGLLIQSLVALRSVDAGFRTDHVLTAEVAVPLPKYADPAARTSFYDEVTARLAAIPGVESVGLTSDLPYTSRGNTMAVQVEGRDGGRLGEDALFRLVSSRYLQTIGATLRAGRFLSDLDREATPPVVVVNDAFVSQYFPGTGPIGHRIDAGTGVDRRLWMTIVGVVADVRERGAELEAKATVYVPYAQTAMSFFQPAWLAVRTAGDPGAIAGALGRAVWSVDPQQPVAHVRTYDAIVDAELAGRRGALSLLVAFAALALLLASLGIYAVISYIVTQSRHEIGVRLAIGASRAAVVRSVLGQAGRLIALGITAGVVGSIASGRVLTTWLFGVSPLDPLAIGGASALLAGLALAAATGPAWRAGSTDPMVALRVEG